MSNLPMHNCQDTVVNWLLLRNNFVILHVRPVLMGAIDPLLLYYSVYFPHLSCE
jgi:predicted membrane-bound dolichyl-phosphate-mannose-protein mannosyltransferase